MSRILLVDDSAHMRRFMSAILTSAGHTVGEASEGREAMAHLSASPTDVVVTDLEMAGVGGREFVRTLKAKGGSMPAIVVCSAALDELGAELREELEAAAVLLSKPFRPRDLFEAISAALSRA